MKSGYFMPLAYCAEAIAAMLGTMNRQQRFFYCAIGWKF